MQLILIVQSPREIEGKTHLHQSSPMTFELLAVFNILPQVGFGSTTPKPRKEREDSVNIHVAKSRVAFTIMTVMTLGRI